MAQTGPIQVSSMTASSWPVSLTTVKNYLKIDPENTADDSLLQSIIIPAATMYAEKLTGKMLAQRDFLQCLDSFPYYPYSREPYGTLYGVGALALYFGYGPIVPTPYPPFGLNAADRMPFSISLLANPVSKIKQIQYVDLNGEVQTITPDNEAFIADILSTPARVLPPVGGVWPQCTIGANNVQILYTAGLQWYDPEASPPQTEPEVEEAVGSPPNPPSTISPQQRINSIPEDLLVAILMACSHFHANRDAVVAGNAVKVPHGLDDLCNINKIYDFSLGLV